MTVLKSDLEFVSLGKAARVESSERIRWFLLSSARLTIIDGSDVPKELPWRPISKILALLPGDRPRLAALYLMKEDATLVAVEFHSGGYRYLRLGRIGKPRALRAPKKGPSNPIAVEGSSVAWRTARRIEYRSAPKGSSLLDVTSPSLASFDAKTFIAGECMYPTALVRGVWVAAVDPKAGRPVKGSLLGKGRRPALAAWKDSMVCFAVSPSHERERLVPKERMAGRLVAWLSEDGKTWKSADPRIPLGDAFRADAHSYQGKLYVACVSNPKRPKLQVFRFPKWPGKPDKEIRLGLQDNPVSLRNLSIRVLQDRLLVLWEEKLADGRRRILVRSLEITPEKTTASADSAHGGLGPIQKSETAQ